MAIASRSPNRRFVPGVYGKNPVGLCFCMSDQSQYDRNRRLARYAANALSETALNDRPGGSISPFCDPATVTSARHSSWR